MPREHATITLNREELVDFVSELEAGSLAVMRTVGQGPSWRRPFRRVHRHRPHGARRVL